MNGSAQTVKHTIPAQEWKSKSLALSVENHTR